MSAAETAYDKIADMVGWRCCWWLLPPPAAACCALSPAGCRPLCAAGTAAGLGCCGLLCAAGSRLWGVCWAAAGPAAGGARPEFPVIPWCARWPALPVGSPPPHSKPDPLHCPPPSTAGAGGGAAAAHAGPERQRQHRDLLLCLRRGAAPAHLLHSRAGGIPVGPGGGLWGEPRPLAWPARRRRRRRRRRCCGSIRFAVGREAPCKLPVARSVMLPPLRWL